MTSSDKPDLHAPAFKGWWTPPETSQDPADWQLWPYRLVDSQYQGWHPIGGAPPGIYRADYDRVPRMSYADIDAERGPVRHVITVPDADWTQLTEALIDAGRHAIGSILVAWFRLFHGELIPGTTREAMDARSAQLDLRRAMMTAGRAGSSESESMYRLAWSAGCDLDDRPRRFNAATVKELVEIMTRWTSGYPRFYVEVADTINSAVAHVIEHQGGWNNICDGPLRRGAKLPQTGAETIRLHFDSSHEYDDAPASPRVPAGGG